MSKPKYQRRAAARRYNRAPAELDHKSVARRAAPIAIGADTSHLGARPQSAPEQGRTDENSPKNRPAASYETAPPPLPGPSASQAEKARAYGRYCKGQSKKHVKDQAGAPFSQCVTAMAKAATNKKLPAQKACSGLSKEHVKGQKGTSFSRCVVGVGELRKQQKRGG